MICHGGRARTGPRTEPPALLDGVVQDAGGRQVVRQMRVRVEIRTALQCLPLRPVLGQCPPGPVAAVPERHGQRAGRHKRRRQRSTAARRGPGGSQRNRSTTPATPRAGCAPTAASSGAAREVFVSEALAGESVGIAENRRWRLDRALRRDRPRTVRPPVQETDPVSGRPGRAARNRNKPKNTVTHVTGP